MLIEVPIMKNKSERLCSRLRKLITTKYHPKVTDYISSFKIVDPHLPDRYQVF